MSHIEKSAFHRGEYVGYGAGEVWRELGGKGRVTLKALRALPEN